MREPDLGAAANRDWAARAWDALVVAAPDAAAWIADDDALAEAYAVVVGASEGAGMLLAREPGLLTHLVPDGGDGAPMPLTTESVAQQGVDAVRAAVGGGLDDPAAREALARVQRGGLLRIAARDMLGVQETDRVALELSVLADGLIIAALRLVDDVADDPDAARLVVIGMGKLGGQELNYVSDVDVLFVHEGDTSEALRRARQVLALLGGHSSLGQPYEMDANLRPEGRNGPLSRTIASYEAYWERWAKTWEFQALMKARPVGGPDALASAFSVAADAAVWPAALAGTAVEEIQAMKGQVERSKPVARDGQRHLKLAPGGLRDIEFSTQLLQLVHGPADPSLRVRGTIPGLRALSEGGYVDEGDAALFADAYLFLRTVEHRLQLRQLRRTHTLPDDRDGAQRLARAMGFRDLPATAAVEQFDKELTRVRGGVRRIHERLFYRPLLSTIAAYADDDLSPSDGGFDATAVEVRLRALAFTSPGRARADIVAMASGSRRSARQLRVVLPTMLETLAGEPDPDGGLAALRTLAERLRDSPRFVRTVRDNPPAARLLASVLGRSPRLGEWLARQPEVLSLLDDEEALAVPVSHAHLSDVTEGLLRRGGGVVGRDALRRVKRREALRIALRDVHGDADVVQVGHELTWLGESLLRAGLATTGDERARLALIGMGRFGASELGHASDLDVIAVHEGPTGVALGVMAGLVSFLGDVTPERKAFRLDLDLRPEGRLGPLSRSLDSHLAYYDRWAEPWELQALTQARVVAGDQALGQAFLDGVRPLVHPAEVTTERLVAIRTMKARVEAERAGGGVRGTRHTSGASRVRADGSGSRDLKLGPGGLSDVEWTVQLLQIAHGASRPEVTGPGTLQGIQRLADAGLLTAEDARWLHDGWLVLSSVRNALYLLRIRDTSMVPQDPDVRTVLAKLLGHASGQDLLEAVDRARRRVRKVFDRRFYD